jgi:hypothetical protein
LPAWTVSLSGQLKEPASSSSSPELRFIGNPKPLKNSLPEAARRRVRLGEGRD